jgi:hypothetical protein
MPPATKPMTPNTLKRVCAAALLTAISVTATVATEPQSLTGTWIGAYTCPQGRTGLTLTIDKQTGPLFSGFFHFYPIPENDRPKEGCYAVSGTIAADGAVKIIGGRWITQPPSYVVVDLEGAYNPRLDQVGGTVISRLGNDPPNCTTFRVLKQEPMQALSPLCQGQPISRAPTLRSLAARP